jgi:hypothetical protein
LSEAVQSTKKHTGTVIILEASISSEQEELQRLETANESIEKKLSEQIISVSLIH